MAAGPTSNILLFIIVSVIHDTRRRSLEMARFLRSRRGVLSPNVKELQAQPRRRVAGLTRTEIAARAGVSLTWYSWLEMGRDVRASTETLASIARALELNGDETSYLLTLADGHVDVKPGAGELAGDVLCAIVDGFRDYPAFVVDRRWSVVASNAHARAIYGFAPATQLRQNILYRLLRDPSLREMHADVDQMMQSVAAIVRYNYADDPENSELLELVRALEEDERFHEAWNRYSVRTFAPFCTEVQWNGNKLHFRFVALAAGYQRRETLVIHIPLDDETQTLLRTLPSSS